MRVSKNNRTKFPIWPTATGYLLLQHFNSPEWVYGVACTLAGIIWIACIVSIWKQEPVDIFEYVDERTGGKQPNGMPKKKSFQERINEIRK